MVGSEKALRCWGTVIAAEPAPKASGPHRSHSKSLFQHGLRTGILSTIYKAIYGAP